jgi:hypothetical protein
MKMTPNTARSSMPALSRRLGPSLHECGSSHTSFNSFSALETDAADHTASAEKFLIVWRDIDSNLGINSKATLATARLL